MLYSWRTYPSLFHGLRFICIIYCHVSATSILVTCIKSRGFVDLREHWRRYLMMWITVYWFISWKSFPSVEGLTRSIKVGRIQYDFFFREIIWHNFEHHAKCKQSCIEILRNSFHRNIVDTLIISTGVRRKGYYYYFYRSISSFPTRKAKAYSNAF